LQESRFLGAASSTGIAVLASWILQIQGFGALPGIVIVVACSTGIQVGYLAGAFRNAPLVNDETCFLAAGSRNTAGFEEIIFRDKRPGKSAAHS
jgi:hypothetical protein